jgi:MFS family permease
VSSKLHHDGTGFSNQTRSWPRRVKAALPAPGPIRVLQTNTLIATTGYGLYTSGSVIFFVKVAKIPEATVGLGLSVAGLLSLLLAVHLGKVADHVGARDAAIGFNTLLVALLAAAVFVRNPILYILLAGSIGLAETGGNVSRGALVGKLVPKEGRVRLSAANRVITNIGFTVGMLLAGIALGFNTKAAYTSLVLGMALASALAAVSSLRLPRDSPSGPKPANTKRRSAYDVPYIAVAMVSGMTLIGNTVLTVGLPLWIITQTRIPHVVAAWMIIGNTVLVILLQVRVSKGADTVPGARRMQRSAFLALAIASVVAAATHHLGAIAGTAVIVIVVGLLTLGELWGESASWSFRYGLADARAQGSYGGMYSMGSSFSTVVGPAAVTFFTGRFVPMGWFVLAFIFLIGLALNGPVIAWAQRTRPETEEDRADGRPGSAELTAAANGTAQ